MNWKQPISTKLTELTNGNTFAATVLALLLLRATNKEKEVPVGDTFIPLRRGQCICGRYELAKCLGLKKSEAGRVQLILNKLEKRYKLIIKQKSRDCSIITINNYDDLVRFDTPDEQTASYLKSNKKQTSNTNKSVKNVKIDESVDHSEKEKSEYGSNTERI